MCGAFHVVLLQEAADHIPHISEQFHTYTDGDNLAILLNKDTFLPNADKHPIVEESASKNTWGLTALIVRGHPRRPPAGSPKMVTLCSVHLHNVVAKKRVEDVFSDAKFMAPGSFPSWGAGGLAGDNEDCTGFLCMPRRPFHWFVNKHGVHTFSNDQLGLNERDESTQYPVFTHLWATHLPAARAPLYAVT